MSQQIITNGEGGLPVRVAINANFTELYSALSLPIRDEGINGNAQVQIPVNCVIVGIIVRPDAGAPVLAIGDAPAGGNILGQQPVNTVLPIQMLWPMLTGGILYFTLSGGTVSISILTVNNVF